MKKPPVFFYSHVMMQKSCQLSDANMKLFSGGHPSKTRDKTRRVSQFVYFVSCGNVFAAVRMNGRDEGGFFHEESVCFFNQRI
ncbi:hypothetical protein CHH86_22185 [Bacillus paralicheniformis]|nr:hypothetical protein CHH86_22185 [Bacillus paralicheniformis]